VIFYTIFLIFFQIVCGKKPFLSKQSDIEILQTLIFCLRSRIHQRLFK